MFCSSDHFSTHFAPVNTAVELFINQATYGDVVSSDKIEPMADFRTWLGIVLGSYDSLDRLIQDDIGELVAGEQGAD